MRHTKSFHRIRRLPCVVMLQRNLLYTGMMRGRRLVVLVGSRRALAVAIKNDQATSRFTRLAARLRGPSPSSGSSGRPNRSTTPRCPVPSRRLL